MESSFRIARVGGIEIGASWSWLIVFGIVVWSLATAVFPAAYPDLGAGAHLAMAVVTAVLFFASILLHELGHARRALREGVPIEGITLWLLGGVARIRSHPRSAGAAFRVAVMGPVITAALAVGLGILTYVASRLDLPDGVQGVLGYLTRINLIVLGFNLIPALPLDGGRIFQAWIWHRTGNPTEATVQAAAAGRVFGYLLVVIGLLGLFGGSDLGGIWLVFVGWFLVQAAGAERTNALLRRTLGNRRVRDAMTPAPVTVPPDLPLDEFVAQAWQGRHSTYPVVADGELLGLVGVRDVSRVPPDERPSRRVGDIMVPRSELATIDADSELADVLDALDGGSRRLPVLDGGMLVGILAPSDVAKAIEIGEVAPRDGESTAVRRRSAGPVVWAPVGLAFVLAAGFLYHPPFVVVEPGVVLPAEDDVTIEGATVTEVNGDYQLTAVSLGRANALGTLVAWVRPDREVIPIDEVIPPGVDPQEYDESQRELFDESRQVAAAAAAQAAGLDVTIDGDGATVVEVVADAPASGRARARRRDRRRQRRPGCDGARAARAPARARSRDRGQADRRARRLVAPGGGRDGGRVAAHRRGRLGARRRCHHPRPADRPAVRDLVRAARHRRTVRRPRVRPRHHRHARTRGPRRWPRRRRHRNHQRDRRGGTCRCRGHQGRRGRRRRRRPLPRA